MAKKRLFITGSSGYVGSKLVPSLAQHFDITAYDAQHFGNPIEGTPGVDFIKGDIRDATAVGDALKGCDTVIHLAGIVTDELVDQNATLAHDINVTATKNLFVAAEAQGIKRIVYASSSSIYGASDVPSEETDDPHPMSEYAKQKLQGEELLWDVTMNTDTIGVAIRSATLCGPAPRMRLDTIVNTFSAQAYFDHKVTVWGGGQWRSNVHIDDAVEAYRLMVTADGQDVQQQVYNLTNGNDTAINIGRRVAVQVGVFLDRNIDVDVDADKIDTRHYQMASDKLWKGFRFRPQRNIERAALDNCFWFRDGGVEDYKDSIFWNSKRMKEFMATGGA